jgi:hypothetical protein
LVLQAHADSVDPFQGKEGSKKSGWSPNAHDANLPFNLAGVVSGPSDLDLFEGQTSA